MSNETLLIDEFEIIELEDRLELAARCNISCEDSGDVIVVGGGTE